MSLMRLILLLPLILAACTAPNPEAAVEAPTSAVPEGQSELLSNNTRALDSPAPPSSPPPIPKGPIKPPTFVRRSISGIEIEAVTFDSRSHFLAVADQAGGPGSQWPDSRAAGRATGGIAAINAGFFTPEGAPLGKVTASGTSRGAVNRASSLGSGFYVREKDSMDLIRREHFRGGDQALQSGPLLVEGSRAVGGLSDKQSSARSFVAYDSGNRWLIARSGPCSLAALAKAIEGQSIGGVPVKVALNLDGGRSSEIWVSGGVSNGPRFQRPFWNKPVRNFLVLRPRN